MEDIIRSNNEFVVLDLETSHFHPSKGAMIIEIAAVKIRDGKIIDKRTQLIDPERNITKKITEITGITNEMLKGKPKYREVLPNFYKFLGDAPVVAHNSSFDWDRFLLFFLKKVGIYPKNQTIDTLALSRKYLKSDEGYRLEKVCERIGVEHKNKHRALGDTEVTAELFLYIKNNFIDTNIDSAKQIEMGSDSRPKEVANEARKAQVPEPQEVRKVAYWEKVVKDKEYKRLYVTLDRSVVFYDEPTNSWEVKASNEPIDFSRVENKVLKHLNVSNIKEACSYSSIRQ